MVVVMLAMVEGLAEASWWWFGCGSGGFRVVGVAGLVCGSEGLSVVVAADIMSLILCV